MSTQQLMQHALTKLDMATAHTAGAEASRVAHLSAVLRGRALLNLGRYNEAASAVDEVPTAFTYGTMHSSKTERQKLFAHTSMYYQDALLVSDREGRNGLDFVGAEDPRVVIDGVGSPSRLDNRTPRYYLRKYNSASASVTVASGVEARLIEAEAALQREDITTFLRRLNEARAPYGMSAVSDPASATGRVDLLFRERAFALFGTAHRLGDLRRLVRLYGRSAESVFPTGVYHKDNLMRGRDVNIAIPASEKANPKFSGCLHRGA
jgi:hypothetical protein